VPLGNDRREGGNRDDLRTFDPVGHPVAEPPCSLEDAPAGGLGIPLLRAYCSTLEYRRERDHDVLTMVLTRRPS
jgi:serine/threonine-protein kinase RsbW